MKISTNAMRDRTPLERQQALAALLPSPCLIALSTGTTQSTQGAQYAPFRPHSHAYYLTGISEPDAVLLIHQKTHGEIERAIIIKNPPAKERLWSDTHQLNPHSTELQSYTHIFCWGDIEAIKSWLDLISQDTPIFLADLCPQASKLFPSSSKSETLLQALSELRCHKEPSEIALMKHAAHISALGHAKLASCWAANESDWELLWRNHCWEMGARQQAYLPIIAAGERSCCLHYHSNNKQTTGAQWVLVDAGAEWQYYASDITRTFFRNCQGSMVETIYKRLLDLQKRLCASVAPGVSLDSLEMQAREEMATWLVEWGWLTDSDSDPIAATRKYFPHRLGHQLGLDVHDNSSMITSSRILETSMVVTIEPGFYCSPLLLPQDHPCLGLGIRIEDDLLVTESGSVVLSHAAPKEWDEVNVEC